MRARTPFLVALIAVAVVSLALLAHSMTGKNCSPVEVTGLRGSKTTQTFQMKEVGSFDMREMVDTPKIGQESPFFAVEIHKADGFSMTVANADVVQVGQSGLRVSLHRTLEGQSEYFFVVTTNLPQWTLTVNTCRG